MYYIAHYQSPLGNITMASDGKSLVGLWFEGQKYYGAGIGLDCQLRPTLPIFSLTCCWLNEYFSSREPSFTPPILLLGSTFRQRVWNELLKNPMVLPYPMVPLPNVWLLLNPRYACRHVLWVALWHTIPSR